jgi:predicted NUDIX family NTP pyrophosphohydrolase
MGGRNGVSLPTGPRASGSWRRAGVTGGNVMARGTVPPARSAKIEPTMAATSAGLLLYRRRSDGEIEVLLAHPGGPFWARKDEGAWSVPKGEYGQEDDPLETAYREFEEELGLQAPPGQTQALGEVRQPGGKRVTVWALEGDLDVSAARSNTFEMEWPRGSGTMREFPEVDRVAWLPLPEARNKLLKGQLPLLDLLVAALGHP